MTGVRKALALSIVQRVLNLVIQVGSTMVLARLITPAQTGIFSLAVGLVAIVQMFRDFGVGEYLVQEKHLDQDLLRAAFAIALTMGWALGLVLIGLSAPIARFYHEPVVEEVIRILSINFFLVPVGYISNALLTREMRFDVLLYVQTASALVGAIVAIALAWGGYGAVGLAWALVAGGATNIVGLMMVSPGTMVYRPSWVGWSRIGRFGMFKTGSFLLEQVMKRAPDFFISRAQGFAASGLYSRANGFADSFGDFLVGSVYRVALPTFAKLRNDGRPVGEAYVLANRLFACLPLSFFSFAAIYADPMIQVMFGDQWGGAVIVMRWLAVSALIITPAMLAAPVLTANGAVDRLLRVQLIANPLQIALVAAASLHSIETVAACMVIAATLRLCLMHREVSAVTQAGARDMWNAIVPGLTVAAVALVAPTLFLLWAESMRLSALLTFAGGVALYVPCWLASLYVLRHPYRSEVGRLLDWLRTAYTRSVG